MKYFGLAWASGICDDGEQVVTPVGDPCLLCGEPIEDNDQGTFMFDAADVMRGTAPTMRPAHRECSLRSVLGGIGHLEDHHHWCQHEGDPDGGRSYRQSALEVWSWVMHGGIA